MTCSIASVCRSTMLDTSVVLALMGGAHHGTGDYLREPFSTILCSVFVRQRILHTRPERRAVLRRGLLREPLDSVEGRALQVAKIPCKTLQDAPTRCAGLACRCITESGDDLRFRPPARQQPRPTSAPIRHQMRSYSPLNHPEPEQHEQAVEEVGAALGYGVGHDPHRITSIFSRSCSTPKLPVHVGSMEPGGKRRATTFRGVCHRMVCSSLR